MPVVWAPGNDVITAGLVFRVGRADETLPRSGVTHLVEHLVLHGVEWPDLHYNGATGTRTTTFVAQGDADEVTSFLAAVCRGLRDLPVDRIDAERAVLRAEAARQSPGVDEQLLAWRYGPAGYGLPGYAEIGVNALTADDVRGWVATWFTRGNATLWISGGPPPHGLRLDLPDGKRMPLPPATAAQPRLPAYTTIGINGVAFDAIVPRSSAAMMCAAVLDRRLHAELRGRLSASYDPHASYQPRDAANARILAHADGLAERTGDVCRVFVDTLVDLANAGPSTDDLAVAYRYVRRGVLGAAGTAAELATCADRLLTGLPLRTGEETCAEAAAVTPADVVTVARQALDTGFALVPHGQAIGRAGFVAAPTGSAVAVDGEAYRPAKDAQATRRLVLGGAGVSLTEGLSVATVRFADCVAMLKWPDGARLLLGRDGVAVRIEPSLWTVPPSALAGVDAAVPVDRTVDMPPGDTASGDVDDGGAEPARRDPPEPLGRGGWAVVLLVVGSMAAVLVLLLWWTDWRLTSVAAVVFSLAIVRAVALRRGRAVGTRR